MPRRRSQGGAGHVDANVQSVMTPFVTVKPFAIRAVHEHAAGTAAELSDGQVAEVVARGLTSCERAEWPRERHLQPDPTTPRGAARPTLSAVGAAIGLPRPARQVERILEQRRFIGS